MLLTKIALHNYSAFEGTQAIDLSSTGEKKQNITLIGAMNGAGKTSLLEAVRLCLYGERNSGLLQPKETPTDFIRKRFNYNARDRHETTMWIELAFDDTQLPDATEIQVRRTWHFHSVRGSYENEELTIHKDGKELQVIDRDHWQDFINDTIPPGVAGFFFFDGEKIQQLADDETDRDALRDSIRNLLGLNVYSRLESDLSKHTEEVRREADKVTDAQLKQLEADEARFRELMRDNRDARAELQAELDDLLEKDELLEREVRRMVGVGADSRNDLQRDVADAENQKKNANEEILKLAGELLPFAITGRLCDELRTQIEAEEKLRQWEASKARVHPQLDSILYKVFHDPNAKQSKPPLSVPQKQFYANRFSEEWEELFIPKPKDAADEYIHELSTKDERFILGTLDKVSLQTVGTLRELLKMRERAAKRIQDTNRELRNLPEDDSHIAQLFDQRKANETAKAQLYSRIGKLDDERASYERELKSTREKIENLKKKLGKAEKDRLRVFLARRIQGVLEKYEKELKNQKLEELEDLTTEMYRRLARKDDFVGRVQIDPQTFDVTVHDTQGRVREKRRLSAGEKQIYAISLLWGLAKASDIELPIIIDTPFARLDSEHRTKIAKHYFPHASEQVIILSTDEEIDHRYVELLRSYIGRSYLIKHNDARRVSHIEAGYFNEQR